MAGPSNDEQYLLELINDARLNPMGDAARYITSYASLTSSDADIQSAFRYFGVSGSALLSQFSALTPVQPVAWNEQLATAARLHDTAMISADEQSHQVAGEASLGPRVNSAGYTGWSLVGENVYAYALNPLYAHAGFMVDWGFGPGGMQSPAGHRDNIMNATFREVGVGIVVETNSATMVGPQVTTTDFGVRTGSGAFILGVAYNDLNGDGFYSPGEGLGTLTASVAGGSTTTWASGGYTLQTFANGSQTVTFTGGGLAGPVSVGLTLTSTSNVKLDIVGGTELRTSASATVSGPIASIVGLGVQGLSLTAVGPAAHRIDGSGGGDTLQGGSGVDVVRGLNGDDRIDGGAGADDINGNLGNDTLHGGDGADMVRGGQGNDVVYGDAGDDPHLNGNVGDDVVYGGAGNDTVFGGQGSDTLYGEDGADLLSGDFGNDLMVGGPGADRFVFRSGGGADSIRDFSSAEGDRIQLSASAVYSVSTASNGDAVIDLGGGDRLTLIGVSPAAMGDWLVVV